MGEPAFAQEAGIEITTDKPQIQISTTQEGAQANLSVSIKSPVSGQVVLSLDDLIVFEGGFGSAPYGSQVSSLSDFLYLEKTEFDFSAEGGPVEFRAPLSIRSGLDRAGYARLLINFQPSEPNYSPVLLPISVIAAPEGWEFPENVVIEPASEIISFKLREDNRENSIKKFIPAIPKIIDSTEIRFETELTYEGKNLSWGQVNFRSNSNLISSASQELSGEFILPDTSRTLINYSSDIKFFTENLPAVGILNIEAFIIDPATDQIIPNSKKTSWAIIFPWKIPFILLVIFLIGVAIWYNYIRRPNEDQSTQTLKTSADSTRRPADGLMSTFDSKFEYLIYLIAKKADDSNLAQEVAKEISKKYKTPKALMRASLKTLENHFAPTSIEGYKAELAKDLAQYLIENFDGTIPDETSEMFLMPGCSSQDLARIDERDW